MGAVSGVEDRGTGEEDTRDWSGPPTGREWSDTPERGAEELQEETEQRVELEVDDPEVEVQRDGETLPKGPDPRFLCLFDEYVEPRSPGGPGASGRRETSGKRGTNTPTTVSPGLSGSSVSPWWVDPSPMLG